MRQPESNLLIRSERPVSSRLGRFEPEITALLVYFVCDDVIGKWYPFPSACGTVVVVSLSDRVFVSRRRRSDQASRVAVSIYRLSVLRFDAGQFGYSLGLTAF